MTQDNSDVFEIFNMSGDEQLAISEFTGNCIKFVQYCQQEFNLDVAEAHFVAGSTLNILFKLVEINPELRQMMRRNAEYIKQRGKNQVKRTDKNPPDESSE